jgi:hypothetical protein
MRTEQTITDWLEGRQPSMEDATFRLLQMLRKDSPRCEIMEVVDYLDEFWQDNDPRSMGWVGSDGLP